MRPKKPTMDKIKKINIAIKKGASEKEIRDTFFGRSIGRRDSFFANYGEFLISSQPEKLDEVVIPSDSTESPKNQVVTNDTLIQILPTLLEMVKLYEDNNKKELNLNSILDIPEEKRRLNDVQYRSYGLSDKVKEGLESLYAIYPQFSKVAILNFLLSEGLKKYLPKESKEN